MIKQYFDLLNVEYSNPPRNTVKLLKKALSRNRHKIFKYKDNNKIVGAVTIFTIHKRIFVIHELIVDKDYRNKNIATKIMRDVHKTLKGIFLVKTINASGFYKKLGYKEIKRGFLAYINDKDVLGRGYWI